MSDWARKIDRRVGKDQTANIPTKGGRNVTYDYVSVEQMIDAANRVSFELGERWHIQSCKLVQVMDFLAVELEAVAMRDGDKFRTSSIQVPVVASNGAPIDKAVLGAVTRATVYLLRGMFGIVERVSGDDSDINARDDTDYAPQPKPNPKPSRTSYPPGAKDFASLKAAIVWVRDQYDTSETVENIRDTVIDLAGVRGTKAKDYTPAHWDKLNNAICDVCDSYMGAQ